MKNNNYYESEIFENLNINGECFCDYEFVDCRFVNCNFTDIKLMRCALLDCSFSSCHMSMINPHMTRLRSAEFDGCFIQGVNWMEYSGSSSYALPFASFRSCSRRKIIRTRFSDANFCFCRVKILGNASAFPAFFPCTNKNLLSENSYDLKLMNF